MLGEWVIRKGLGICVGVGYVSRRVRIFRQLIFLLLLSIASFSGANFVVFTDFLCLAIVTVVNETL